MKKVLPISVFIILLSLSAFAQEGDTRNGLPENVAALHLNGPHQQIPNDLLSINALNPESGRNDNFLLIWRYRMVWDFSESVWEHDRKIFYSYDEYNNPVERFESWTDGSGPYEKTISFYDTNHTLDEERVYKYSGSEWVNYFKTLYYYDGNNNLMQETRQVWNGDQFENQIKDTYGYNANNQKIYQMMYYWEDEAWKESQKFDFQYDGNNNLSLILSEAWIDNAWVNWLKSMYAWDTTGNLLSIVSSKWDSENSVWLHPYNKQYYSYDLDNNRIIFVIQHWFEDDEIWINDYKSTYYYVPTGSETVEHKSSGINKPINDFQNTEDDIIIEPGREDKVLIGVEVMIDTVLHTSVGDLEFTLSHNGINQKIINLVGGDGDNFTGTRISDYGVDTLTNGIAPFFGIYKPGNPLSSFLGIDPAGKWTLSIYDGTAGNNGTLQSWGLNLIYGSGSSFISVPNENASFTIYPNPTHGKFQITNSKIQIQNCEVVDLSGNVLMAKGKQGSGEAGIEFDVSFLPAGVYFVRISLPNSLIVKNIVKL
jgi:hypothetical protein